MGEPGEHRSGAHIVRRLRGLWGRGEVLAVNRLDRIGRVHAGQRTACLSSILPRPPNCERLLWPRQRRTRSACWFLRGPKMFNVNEHVQSPGRFKDHPQPTFVSLQPIAVTGARDKIATKVYIRARPSSPNVSFSDPIREAQVRFLTWENLRLLSATMSWWIGRSGYQKSWSRRVGPRSLEFATCRGPESLLDELIDLFQKGMCKGRNGNGKCRNPN